MRRGTRQQTVSGDEWDWLYGRRWYAWRAGVGRAIKRALSKRRRKRAKVLHGITSQYDDEIDGSYPTVRVDPDKVTWRQR